MPTIGLTMEGARLPTIPGEPAFKEIAVKRCSMRFDAKKGQFAETIERMQPSQVNCYLDVRVYLGEPQTV
jgi:hypothetical protein